MAPGDFSSGARQQLVEAEEAQFSSSSLQSVPEQQGRVPPGIHRLQREAFTLPGKSVQGVELRGG